MNISGTQDLRVQHNELTYLKGPIPGLIYIFMNTNTNKFGSKVFGKYEYKYIQMKKGKYKYEYIWFDKKGQIQIRC